jgi:hypothetical protein
MRARLHDIGRAEIGFLECWCLIVFPSPGLFYECIEEGEFAHGTNPFGQKLEL